ncbi:hypothetical protein DSO57_1001529 [Entomophthora muscae]|uniref:Uncharacterized protein n=1 Tax=Entomophthora muscae TaxID=34485 RepID=A0ACC2RP08_9FUNG|nr:hypothetical protein DSO57_1001529 [Entomophthora muscae]
MGPLEFVKDRAIILSLVLGYTAWKETYGQAHWKILTTKLTDFHLFLITYPVVLIVYFTFSLIFAYIDFFIAPDGGISGVRLQPKKDHTWKQYKRAIPLVMFNLFVMSPILTIGSIYLLFPASPYYTDQPSGMYPSLPSTFMVLRDLLLSMVLRDMIFYYLHRLFHHPAVYATFHKKHHEFTAPIAVSGNSYLTY